MRNGMLLGVGTVFGALAIGVASFGLPGLSGADDGTSATLRDPAGLNVGTVRFSRNHDRSEVRVKLQFDPTKVTTSAFHGMHIHANGDAANGSGCIADATKEPTTWFVSADGHWKTDGQDHASHLGDLLSIYVTEDGSAEARFTISGLDRSALAGKAVIVHAERDNFGNVPVGSAANQYTPNSAEATTATKNTGNAGPRIACGVIGER